MNVVYEKGSTITMVTWYNSRVMSKKSYISVFTWLHDYQTGQDRTTIHKVIWFFEHVIICSLVTNKKRYFSNSTSPMDIKLDRVMASDFGPKLKKNTSLLVKSFLHSWILFPISEMSLIGTTIRSLLLVREKEPPTWTFMNLYVTLHEIHGSIW